MPRHNITGSSYIATNGSGGTSGPHGAAFVFDFYALDWRPDVEQPLDSHIGAGHLRHGNGRIPDNRVDELAKNDAHLHVDGVRVLVATISPQPLFTDNEGLGQLYIDLRNYNGANNQDFRSDEPTYIVEMLLHGEFGGPFADFTRLKWEPTKMATIAIGDSHGLRGGGPTTITAIETPPPGGGGNPLSAKFTIQPVATQGQILHKANVTNFTWSGGDIGDLHFDGQGEVAIDLVYDWPEDPAHPNG